MKDVRMTLTEKNYKDLLEVKEYLKEKTYTKTYKKCLEMVLQSLKISVNAKK